MRRMSLDLETLGTNINSRILSIGVAIVDDENGLITSSTIYPSVNAQWAREVDNDTLVWWMGQSDEARFETFLPEDMRRPIPEAMSELDYLWHHYKAEEVWGNGPVMDVAMVEGLTQDFNIGVPWSFRQVRCLRTLKMLAPDVERIEPEVAHSARHDAIAQGLWAREMIKCLRK